MKFEFKIALCDPTQTKGYGSFAQEKHVQINHPGRSFALILLPLAGLTKSLIQSTLILGAM